jgi:hypothetical protein
MRTKLASGPLKALVTERRSDFELRMPLKEIVNPLAGCRLEPNRGE